MLDLPFEAGATAIAAWAVLRFVELMFFGALVHVVSMAERGAPAARRYGGEAISGPFMMLASVCLLAVLFAPGLGLWLCLPMAEVALRGNAEGAVDLPEPPRLPAMLLGAGWAMSVGLAGLWVAALASIDGGGSLMVMSLALSGACGAAIGAVAYPAYGHTLAMSLAAFRGGELALAAPAKPEAGPPGRPPSKPAAASKRPEKKGTRPAAPSRPRKKPPLPEDPRERAAFLAKQAMAAELEAMAAEDADRPGVEDDPSPISAAPAEAARPAEAAAPSEPAAAAAPASPAASAAPSAPASPAEPAAPSEPAPTAAAAVEEDVPEAAPLEPAPPPAVEEDVPEAVREARARVAEMVRAAMAAELGDDDG